MKEDDVSSRLVSRSGPNLLDAGSAGCQITPDQGSKFHSGLSCRVRSLESWARRIGLIDFSFLPYFIYLPQNWLIILFCDFVMARISDVDLSCISQKHNRSLLKPEKF